MGVGLVIVGEVGPLEGAVAALGFGEDGDVRLDAALMEQRVEHFGRAIDAVGDQPFRLDQADIGDEAVAADQPSIEASCGASRSEEHTSELQSLMRNSYA